MIVYKVVEKGTRHCSNWALYKDIQKGYGYEINPSVVKFRKDNPELFPRYLKGKTINAAEESCGIYTFMDPADARHFIRSSKLSKGKIIKVKGIGKPTKEVMFIRNCGGDPLGLSYYSTQTELEPLSLEGVLTFKSVLVLE